MTRYMAFAASIMLAVPLSVGFAAAQSKPACDQMKASAPQKVEGKVARIDQANKETLQDLKVGDHIEAKLRELPKC